MRYVVRSPWPVQGGSMLIPGNTIIDTAVSSFLVGVVPPPDVTPLDQEARDMLVQAYQMAFRS
jgi:hypothetical protein